MEEKAAEKFLWLRYRILEWRFQSKMLWETRGKASLHFSKMFFIEDEGHHTPSASSRRAEGTGAQPYGRQCVVGMFPTGGGCRDFGPGAAGPLLL